jgi:hypothetical protein
LRCTVSFPFVGSGADAIDAFDRGDTWTGIGYTVMAISDVFLAKALVMSLVKAAGKTAVKATVKEIAKETAEASAIKVAKNTSKKAATKLLPEAYSRFSRFEYHFGKHAGRFGAAGKDAYYKRALSLLDGPVGGNVQGFTNSAGYTFKMNMRTGEFGVMRPNGVVETFYRRLSDPAKYWAEQVAKWNK